MSGRFGLLAGAGTAMLLVLVLRSIAGLPRGPVFTLLAWDGAAPRLAVALLAGAVLGLAGVLMQAVLRNALADPTTLGTSAGAQLGLTAAALGWPGLGGGGAFAAALAGGMLATALSCGMAAQHRLSAAALVLGGLVISLFCGAAATLLGALNGEVLTSVFVWSSGSLVQFDWRAVPWLGGALVLLAGAAAVLLRPLAVMELDDAGARSLGLDVARLRLLAIAAAVAGTAVVVSRVGVIGFAGLAAPALARAAGLRRLGGVALAAPVAGALLLALTDQLVQAAPGMLGRVPAGSAAALLGAPLLLWLVPRLPETVTAMPAGGHGRARRSAGVLGATVVALLLAGGAALWVARGAGGWGLPDAGLAPALLALRWPRVLAAGAAGASLATAGSLMQAMTGNPMASPEVLGVSAGAAMGVVVLVLAAAAPGPVALSLAACAGAALVLAALLLLGRRFQLAPQRLLLAGVTVTTAFSAVAALLMLLGDPRLQMLAGWLSGSTYLVTPAQAKAAALACLPVAAAVGLLPRMLRVLPMGDGAMRALGFNPVRCRGAVLLVASLATAVGTVVVGPLSFAGLLGPHLARLMGLRPGMPMVAGSALTGALVMVLADWLGRNLMFPYQLPAGLLASLAGCPLLMLALWRAAR